jgi:hypothetical protein
MIMKKIVLITILIFCQIIDSAAEENVNPDSRKSLDLTLEEKAQFLSEMRQMLSSIQGIISGIAEEDPDKIIESAKYSGNRMARATPVSIKNKTPQEFKDIGGPTHMMFEELVIRAETDDMQTLTELTGRILQQCIGCHAIYRAN